MYKLSGKVQSYAWGSRTAIANLRGSSVPSPYPEAEVWFGTHPNGSADIADGNGNLADLIATDPRYHLGPAYHTNSSTQQPDLGFMVKILAAQEPLSLQAHPSQEQAKRGFSLENNTNVPVDAPYRNYKDANAKPEVIIALSEFELLAGFAPADKTIALFEELIQFAPPVTCDRLQSIRDLIAGQRDSGGLRAAFTTIVTLPAHIATELTEGVVQAAIAALSSKRAQFVAHLKIVLLLEEMYPHDFGIVATLLMNHIVLQPGEAVYTPAGVVHSYIQGIGVEVLANSDNVLRAGLTPKHVDVPELLKIVDFQFASEESLAIQPQTIAPGITKYVPGTRSFTVYEYSVPHDNPGKRLDFPTGKPLIIVCTRGTVLLTNKQGHNITLTPTEGAWVSASEEQVSLTGVPASSPEGNQDFHQDAQVFVTTVPDD